MNSDIRVQISFSRHVKRKKLQSRLKAEGVLALIDLWLYAGENHPDGILKGMTSEDISLSANWDGDPDVFISTLIEIGFIDESEGYYSLHDWEENNPYAVHAPERKERAKKAARARWGITDECSEHANSIQDASLSNAPSPTPIPTPTPSPTPIPKSYIPYQEIIAYLNEKTGKHFDCQSKQTRARIKARWGANGKQRTIQDFFTVIDNKCRSWLNDPEMAAYLRPETLFGTKFESYLNEIKHPLSGKVSDKTIQTVEMLKEWRPPV
jgi:uncharacterized phage protein (TIGR02220 family)